MLEVFSRANLEVSFDDRFDVYDEFISCGYCILRTELNHWYSDGKYRYKENIDNSLELVPGNRFYCLT